jgi:hypothetical protein
VITTGRRDFFYCDKCKLQNPSSKPVALSSDFASRRNLNWYCPHSPIRIDCEECKKEVIEDPWPLSQREVRKEGLIKKVCEMGYPLNQVHAGIENLLSSHKELTLENLLKVLLMAEDQKNFRQTHARYDENEDEEEEEDMDDSKSDCIICYSGEISCELVPCHHRCCCTSCAQHLLRLKSGCPLCREKILSIQPVTREPSSETFELQKVK